MYNRKYIIVAYKMYVLFNAMYKKITVVLAEESLQCSEPFWTLKKLGTISA